VQRLEASLHGRISSWSHICLHTQTSLNTCRADDSAIGCKAGSKATPLVRKMKGKHGVDAALREEPRGFQK
jgi:hypothetical protein